MLTGMRDQSSIIIADLTVSKFPETNLENILEDLIRIMLLRRKESMMRSVEENLLIPTRRKFTTTMMMSLHITLRKDSNK